METKPSIAVLGIDPQNCFASPQGSLFVPGSVEDMVKTMEKRKAIEGEGKRLAEVAEEPPIIKLVNLIVMQAVKDIRKEP